LLAALRTLEALQAAELGSVTFEGLSEEAGQTWQWQLLQARFW
jgi:hypothetical protein